MTCFRLLVIGCQLTPTSIRPSVRAETFAFSRLRRTARVMASNGTMTSDTFFAFDAADAPNATDVALADGDARSTLSIVLSSLIVGSICLVSIVGNVAVIYAVMSTSQLKDKTSSIFLVNLSITDLSSAAFVMMSALVCIALDLRRVDAVWCNCMCALNYCLIIVSMMTLALISVDRLLSVLYPFRYHEIVTRGRVVAVVVFAWCQGLVFGVAPAVVGWVHYDYWEAVCAIDWHREPRIDRIHYVITAFALCFVLPALVMLVSYTVTIRYARLSFRTVLRSRQKPNGGGEATTEGHGCRKHNNNNDNLGLKTITSMLVVVAAFFVCLTPFSATKLVRVLADDSTLVPPYVTLWAAFFAYLSSMVNPFIYGILRADFRNAYKRMFRRLTGRRSYYYDQQTPTRRSISTNNNCKQKRYDYLGNASHQKSTSSET